MDFNKLLFGAPEDVAEELHNADHVQDHEIVAALTNALRRQAAIEESLSSLVNTVAKIANDLYPQHCQHGKEMDAHCEPCGRIGQQGIGGGS